MPCLHGLFLFDNAYQYNKDNKKENNPYILQPRAHTGLHTSKPGGNGLLRFTQAVLHSPLRPSKALQLPAWLKKPQKCNWKFRPTQGATIHQTVIGTVAFYPTTDSRSKVVCYRWVLWCSPASKAFSGLDSHCFYWTDATASLIWLTWRKHMSLPHVNTTLLCVCLKSMCIHLINWGITFDTWK